jgi:para-nitrobenzyl esterase
LKQARRAVVPFLLLAFAAVTSAAAATDSGVVKTKFGSVKGLESRDKNYAGVVEFRSIPYAAPPVGDLRWKAPVDPEKWDGVRVCDKYAAIPMQVLGGAAQAPYDQDFYYSGVPEMSEDCLYLNVVTTKDSLNKNAKKPVYIWFHGGGLASCYTFEPENNVRRSPRTA